VDEGRRERARLLRDFERSPLAKNNFCALKGLTVAQLDTQLALAREEAAAWAAAHPPAPRDEAPAGERPREHRGPHDRPREHRPAGDPPRRDGPRPDAARNDRPRGPAAPPSTPKPPKKDPAA
jgi:hypothetical protein